ncbi:MAG: DsrE family protein [Sulfurimonas sp.]
MRVFLFFMLVVTSLFAKEFKAVYDCSSGDMGYVASRMFLVERTKNMMEDNGDSVKFALTIHGKCAPIVSKNYDEVLKDSELESAKLAQEQLKKLATLGIDIVVCAMSLNANAIDEDDVIKEAKISKNSFIETIGYQNDGYALMVFE